MYAVLRQFWIEHAKQVAPVETNPWSHTEHAHAPAVYVDVTQFGIGQETQVDPVHANPVEQVKQENKSKILFSHVAQLLSWLEQVTQTVLPEGSG